MITSSVHKYTDPIRYFKSNDSYYYEIDNIPLQQLMENDRFLKDQIEALSNEGTIDRSNFTELKPYVTGSDNVVHVKPGRFTARINDVYNKTQLQKLGLLQQVIAGDLRQYKTNLATSAFDVIINRLQSDVASSALYLNGLEERVFQFRIANSDQSLPTGFLGSNPTTGANTDLDKWPVISIQPFRKYFSQVLGFSNLPQLEAEFIKMWRGPARTAVVNVDTELTIEVPPFDAADFQSNDPDSGSISNLTNATSRIDLVFIYSHPIDTSSTTIHKYSGGVPQTITSPILGLVRGAGVVVKKLTSNANPAFQNLTTPPLDSDGNSQILANASDQNNSNNGFRDLNIHGSFPAPDDLMNIAPNLIETLESNDYQLIGQSILPVCYIVVRKSATVNTGGAPVINTTDLIDIRPFFRTAELTYSERAGIAAASPVLSLANPAVGQAQLGTELQQLKSRLESQIIGTQTEAPRVVGGGTIWGGIKYGAEGCVRLAAKLLNGIAEANLPYAEAPNYPDWDIADWWTLYPTSVTDVGNRRNDRINVQRKGEDQAFDSGTDPTDATNIATAVRLIGTQHFNGAISNPYCIYWVKKEVLIDTTLVPWMVDYTVECQLVNCIPQVHKSSKSGNAFHEDDSGSAGIWVEKKIDRFFIYVAWLADSSSKFQQDGAVPHGREPRQDRDTFGFSGFITRTSDMGLPTLNNLKYDGSLQSKAPNIGTCTYPTVTFKVTGFPEGYYFKTLAQYPQTSLITLK